MHCKVIETTEKKSAVTQLKGEHVSYKVRSNPETPGLPIFQNSQKTQSNKTRERNKRCTNKEERTLGWWSLCGESTYKHWIGVQMPVTHVNI